MNTRVDIVEVYIGRVSRKIHSEFREKGKYRIKMANTHDKEDTLKKKKTP